MTTPGYNPSDEAGYWWKLAFHLDAAQTALANAMAHNLEDQRPVLAIQDRLNQSQAFLLAILRSKGLVPTAATNPVTAPPVATPPTPMPYVSPLASAPVVAWPTPQSDTPGAPPPPVLFYGKVPPAPRVSASIVMNHAVNPPVMFSGQVDQPQAAPVIATPPPDDGTDVPVVLTPPAPAPATDSAPAAALAPGGESPA